MRRDFASGPPHTVGVVHTPAACASFNAAMEVLAKPWTGLVFNALEDGPRRFSAIRDAIPEIGDRMLALRLRELVDQGLVAREVHEGPPVRVEYALTPAGRGFREVADAARRWGATILQSRAAQTPGKKKSRSRVQR
jgi:DNA-binding HxlR family transcriptional regulator